MLKFTITNSMSLSLQVAIIARLDRLEKLIICFNVGDWLYNVYEKEIQDLKSVYAELIK